MESPPSPTKSELAILNVLWERGGSTVREVQDAMPERREMGYTTVLKLLQIMHQKGLVNRDESHRAHIYSARSPRDRTQRSQVRDLLHRSFGGSTHDLVLRALESEPCSEEELRRIRALLEQFETRGPE